MELILPTTVYHCYASSYYCYAREPVSVSPEKLSGSPKPPCQVTVSLWGCRFVHVSCPPCRKHLLTGVGAADCLLLQVLCDATDALSPFSFSITSAAGRFYSQEGHGLCVCCVMWCVVWCLCALCVAEYSEPGAARVKVTNLFVFFVSFCTFAPIWFTLLSMVVFCPKKINFVILFPPGHI